MKQTIRLNTFETNSSSFHSLVVSKEIYEKWLSGEIIYTEEPIYQNEDEGFYTIAIDESKFQKGEYSGGYNIYGDFDKNGLTLLEYIQRTSDICGSYISKREEDGKVIVDFQS